jgi:hypothetical protein
MQWKLICLASILLSGVMAARATPVQGQQRDGIIEEGEYDTTLNLDGGRYTLAWTITEDTVQFAVAAETTGWVAVGFDPIVVADNADLIFGWAGVCHSFSDSIVQRTY